MSVFQHVSHDKHRLDAHLYVFKMRVAGIASMVRDGNSIRLTVAGG